MRERRERRGGWVSVGLVAGDGGEGEGGAGL